MHLFRLLFLQAKDLVDHCPRHLTLQIWFCFSERRRFIRDAIFCRISDRFIYRRSHRLFCEIQLSLLSRGSWERRLKFSARVLLGWWSQLSKLLLLIVAPKYSFVVNHWTPLIDISLFFFLFLFLSFFFSSSIFLLDACEEENARKKGDGRREGRRKGIGSDKRCGGRAYDVFLNRGILSPVLRLKSCDDENSVVTFCFSRAKDNHLLDFKKTDVYFLPFSLARLFLRLFQTEIWNIISTVVLLHIKIYIDKHIHLFIN